MTIGTQLPPFHVMDILARANDLQAQGGDIIHLEIGQPDFATPEPITHSAIEAVKANKTHYTSAAGLPELRQLIAEDYAKRFACTVKPDQIFITPGGSGAIPLILGYLLGPGKRLMIGDPTYPCNRNLTQVFHGERLMVPVSSETEYQLNADLVEQHWQDDVLAVLIASPANPTGTVCSSEELLKIADYLETKNAYLIVDEIYQGLVYDQASVSVAGKRKNIFVMNSFSKFYGMMGWRLGWVVSAAGHETRLDALAQNTYLASSTIAQYAALAAFDDESFEIYEQRRQEFHKRRDALIDALSDIDVKIPCVPQGAFYLYVDVSNYTDDSFKFCQDLLEEQGVAVTPGIDFGDNEAHKHIRLAYTTKIESILEGVNRLKRFVIDRG